MLLNKGRTPPFIFFTAGVSVMVKKIFTFYCSWIDQLVRIVGQSVSILMPLLALVIAFEVGSRYLFNHPTIWAYDTSLFLSAYLVGLGGAYAYQKKTHINVDILYLSVSPKTKRVFDVLTGLLAMFFMFILMMIAYEKFGEALQFNYRKMSNWAPPTHHFWMMLVVSGALVSLQITSNMVKDIYYVINGHPLIAVPEEEDSEDGN